MKPEVLVLMYHAVDGGDGGPLGADPHYTVSAAGFAAQLDALGATGLPLRCAREGLAEAQHRGVWLTFDDGDLSNFAVAFPLLAERGLRADFFVNPARVGQPGFCSWAQLREMSAAGMSIQSHGYDHRYFTHLSSDALIEDLRRARREIEDAVGREVSLLAPPGGRCPPRLGQIAQDCGYRAVFGSVPGTLRDGLIRGVAPRVAVLASHCPDQLVAWAQHGQSALRRQRLRYGLLAGAKRLLGDRGYERLRGALLGGAAG